MTLFFILPPIMPVSRKRTQAPVTYPHFNFRLITHRRPHQTELPKKDTAGRKSFGELIVAGGDFDARSHSCSSTLSEESIYSLQHLSDAGQLYLVVSDTQGVNWEAEELQCCLTIDVYASAAALLPPKTAYHYTSFNGAVALSWKEVMSVLMGINISGK